MLKTCVTNIAYCGVYCGDCLLRKGKIAGLSQQLMKELKKAEFAKWAQGLSEMMEEFRCLHGYEQFCDILKIMEGLRCLKPCRLGGGTAECKIRICCRDKGLKGCWECPHYEVCPTLAWLRPVNGDENIKNLNLIHRRGLSAFMKAHRNPGKTAKKPGTIKRKKV